MNPMNKYYKVVSENGEIINYQVTKFPCESEFLIEITEEEYNAAIEVLNNIEVEKQKQEKEKKDQEIKELQEKNTELEQENAGLLFQILTGEDYESI